jgi:ketosteroid isomerase-like protein
MKNALLLALLTPALFFYAQVSPPRADESGFRAFLRRWEEAQSRFLNGDPALWKQHSSQGEDATIFGAFGGYEKGWKKVGPRYDWAASQYRPSGAKKQVEYLNVAVGGDLAYTVSIERDEVKVGGQSRPGPRALRVTQVFRREGDAWKLLHRHADPLMEKKAPSATP